MGFVSALVSRLSRIAANVVTADELFTGAGGLLIWLGNKTSTMARCI